MPETTVARSGVVVTVVSAAALVAVAGLWLARSGPEASRTPASVPRDEIGWSVAEGGDDPGPGSFGFTLFDPDRNRTLDLSVVVPDGAGAHPLVVFAHGFATCGSDYDELLRIVAATGFVVAAANSPDSSCVTSAPGRAVDEQARDLAFVVDVLTDPDRVPNALAGTISTGRVGVMGHSDGAGAVTTLVLAANDPRVGAAVILSGALFAPVRGGPFPPMLIVHGTDDAVNPPSASVAVADAAGTSARLVAVQGGSHLAPFVILPTVDVIGTLVGDFFRATLLDDSAAQVRLDADTRSDPLVPWAEARFATPSADPAAEAPPEDPPTGSGDDSGPPEPSTPA